MRRSCRFAGAGPWISAPAGRSGAHRSAVVRGRDTSGSAAPRRLFAAGVITRQLLTARELQAVESKLTAVAKMAPFLALFLIVRGAPALLLYRTVLDRRERIALALLSSTQLPLVVAIADLATAGGHMRASTAAALVGAAALSTLVFPLLGLRIKGASAAEPIATGAST